MTQIQITVEDLPVSACLIRYQDELMELELPDAVTANIGDYVQCRYNLQSLSGRVIRIDQQRICLFIPSSPIEKFGDRRSVCRIEVSLNGYIVCDSGMFPVQIQDISVQGVGFVSDKPLPNTEDDIPLVISTDFFSTVVTLSQAHYMELPDGYRYGGKIAYISRDQIKKLRSFLMLGQMMSTDAVSSCARSNRRFAGVANQASTSWNGASIQ